MKKLLVLLAASALFASCGVQQLIPESVNTINRAQLSDLNLTRKDYTVLATISAEATVISRESSQSKIREISDPSGDFSVKWKLKGLKGSDKKKKGSAWVCTDFQGILRTGALANLPSTTADHADPVDMVEKLALYRLINQAHQEGADAIVEPNYTISAEQNGPRQITYRATVTAKIIKLKTDR